MVGLCGVLGEHPRDVDAVATHLRYRGDEAVARYRDADLCVTTVEHPLDFEEQPVRIDEDRRLWLWGTVLGHEHRGTYERVPDGLAGIEYVARHFERHGWPALAGLNGTFAGILSDGEAGTISLFTDRLCTHPLYVTRADDGSLVFSSSIQSLGRHPGVELSFDPRYLSQFLHYHRSFGTRTPIAGVHQLPPATVRTVAMDGTTLEAWTYWWPNPTPRRADYETFVDEFTQAFTAAVRDRVPADGTPGLLLSGGIDSRAILAVLDGDVRTRHLNEQREGNREARIAERAAAAAGAEYTFLHRDLDHYPSVLEAAGPLSNFTGYFRVANHLGLEDEIRADVSAVFNGHYADTLIGRTYVPMGPDGPRPIESIDAYVDAVDGGEMQGHCRELPFVDGLPDPATVLRQNMEVVGETVRSHGVSYPSWESLLQYGMVYPLTNTRSFIWYETQRHCYPTRYPFLDNRIVDLILAMPAEFRYDRDVVASALEALDPALAGVERLADHPMVFHLRKAPISQLPRDALRFAGLTSGGVSLDRPDSHYSPHSGFPHTPGLIRAHPFIGDLIEEKREAIERTDYLDAERLWDCYERHLDGENFADRLFGIATMLRSDVDPVIPGLGDAREEPSGSEPLPD